ncbi:MAG: LamG domain-containing protein [Chitinophagaceae bacterium]|nr:LamG domain-containing protein [Chitinophagaceae bacterium]
MSYNIKKIFKGVLAGSVVAILGTSCQKMDRPAMGDYPADSNPPGGPLSFFVAFDGTTTNPLMNAVDSIRASFPSDNPLASIDGISGKAVQGVNQKFIKFAKPNDWASSAASFTVSFWYKRDGQTRNNKGGNGPEYIMSLKQTKVEGKDHWSGSTCLVFLEGNNTACAVKTMWVDKNGNDSWWTWEGGQSIPGLLDNKWHHIAIVYNATTSVANLYIDGVMNPNAKGWPGHGPIGLDNNRIQEVRVGAGPAAANTDTDDWLASTWKGGLDQFRLYSSALSAAEVQYLFSGKK